MERDKSSMRISSGRQSLVKSQSKHSRDPDTFPRGSPPAVNI